MLLKKTATILFSNLNKLLITQVAPYITFEPPIETSGKLGSLRASWWLLEEVCHMQIC